MYLYNLLGLYLTVSLSIICVKNVMKGIFGMGQLVYNVIFSLTTAGHATIGQIFNVKVVMMGFILLMMVQLVRNLLIIVM